MNAHPFSLIKRKDRPFYLVAFKDENGKFLSPVSTKQSTEKEAMQVAWQMLQKRQKDKLTEPEKPIATPPQATACELARNVKTKAEAAQLLAELRACLTSFKSRQGHVK